MGLRSSIYAGTSQEYPRTHMMQRILLAAFVALPACTSKPVVPDATASSESSQTSSETGSSGTGANTSGPTSGGIFPPDPVQCGAVTCQPDQLCVVPGKVCVHYDSEGCDPDDGIDDPCADDEPGPAPFCAGLPAECEGSGSYLACVGEALCTPPGSCSDNPIVDGVVTCGPAFCHCP